MMTGNLLKAADKFGNQGKIVHYTDSSGERHPGFLMKKSFEPTRDLAHAPVRLTSVKDIENFTKQQGLSLHTRDVRLSFSYDDKEQVYEISVPKSKKAGGEFFLDKKLLDAATPAGNERNEFYSRGDSSYLYFSPNELQTVVERLDSKWGLYAIGKEDTAVARELVGLEIPDFEDILATALEEQRRLLTVDEAETVEESTVNDIASETLSANPETQAVEIAKLSNEKVIDEAETFLEPNVTDITSETLSTHSETQTVEADRTIDEAETFLEPNVTNIASETPSANPETIEITNSSQIELGIEADISQNSETQTAEITKLSNEITIDETETVEESTVDDIFSETLLSHSETIEVINSPQAESKAEADILQNSETQTLEITNSSQTELGIEADITKNSETQTVETTKLSADKAVEETQTVG